MRSLRSVTGQTRSDKKKIGKKIKADSTERLLHSVSSNRMSTAQGRICGLNSSRKGAINECPKLNPYEDVDILRIKVADGITEWVSYMLLILLHLTYICK
jgi:hypothetical protein